MPGRILAEAVHSHAGYAPDSSMTQFCKRIAKKKGRSKAAVVAASRMLRTMCHMLSEKRELVIQYGQDRRRGILGEGKPRNVTAQVLMQG